MAIKPKAMKKEQVQENADMHIDQDFPGYPHSPSNEKSITPKTTTEKKLADAEKDKSKKVYGG
jgi:hypothetical protein